MHISGNRADIDWQYEPYDGIVAEAKSASLLCRDTETWAESKSSPNESCMSVFLLFLCCTNPRIEGGHLLVSFP